MVGTMARPTTAWIVGATSLLGWSIARQAAPGWDLRPCCSRHSRSARTREWIRLNVEEPRAWERLRRAPPDTVIYCAGVCDVQRCEDDPAFSRAINVDGVAAMLDALGETTRLVYCSSDHVFGAGGRAPFVETSPRCPVSVYGRARVEAEDLVQARRPDALVVRVGLPIGPSLDGKTGHLDWLRHRHRAGLPMTVVRGEWRTAVDADLAARRILELAASRLHGVRHLAAPEPTSRPDLAARLCARLQISEPAYDVVDRSALPLPHVGRVALGTRYADALARPLPVAA